MKQVLLFGAGRSATVLIHYLLSQSVRENWKVVVADANLAIAKEKLGNHPNGEAISLDIVNDQQRAEQVMQADVVISMLPPTLHNLVAKDCLKYSKHLLTASYVDDSMRNIAAQIEQKGILFLCETGLDPGIDHMSAMQIIDDIRSKDGKITSFKSHCGGLVAPESDNNPWHYKISWNSRNIILAGKSGAHYEETGKEVKLKYEQLFNPANEVNVPNIGPLSWYANRDSLSYAPLYGLTDTHTFLRTTLRHADFMRGWNAVIELKLTDETETYYGSGRLVKDIFIEHLDKHSLQNTYNDLLKDKLIASQLDYLGLNDSSIIIENDKCSAADLLQKLAEQKLSLQPHDKDMIVMLHEFEYELNGSTKQVRSSLVVKGEDSLRTAMAKTVGLPLGIAAKLLLKDQLSVRGLQIPTVKEIYEPVLAELNQYGVSFIEQHS